MESNLRLPDGLPISGFTPEWLGDLWPFTTLTSDVGSIMKVLLICVGLAIVSFVLLYLAKTFLPGRVGKFLGKSVFFVLGISLLAGGALGVMSWKQEYKISDYEMGLQVTKVMDYAKVNGASIDNRTAWDLTCDYYDNANDNCRPGQHATTRYKGIQTKVKLERADDGTVEMLDYEKLLPLFR